MKTSKDLVNKRRDLIMKEIQIKKTVDVDELAEKFSVSKITVRRDLQYWEDQGAVEKYYGGARLIQNFVENDKDNNEAYKHAIAKYAATFVEDGDTIFINTSSTALLIIKYIIGKRVTVITNNGKAIFTDHDPNVQIILTGGELRIPKTSMVGDFALNNLNKVKANKSFLGCSGFDVKAGMSTAILQEVSINEIMISRCAGEVFILADATKINYVHQFIVADPSNFNYLITDTRCTDEQIDQFTEKGIKTKRLSPIYIYK